MKLEIEFIDNEYVIVLNKQKVFSCDNHKRILREVRNLIENHNQNFRFKK